MLSGPGEAGKSTVTVALADAARDGGAACGLHVARSRESGQGVGVRQGAGEGAVRCEGCQRAKLTANRRRKASSHEARVCQVCGEDISELPRQRVVL